MSQRASACIAEVFPELFGPMKDHGTPEFYLDVAEALEVADGELGQHLMKPFSRLSFEIGVFSCYRSNCTNSSLARWYVRKTSFATVYVSPS